MKRTKLFIFPVWLVLMCIVACTGESVQKKSSTDLEKQGLRGKVRKMTEYNSVTGISSYQVFNEAGNVIEKGTIRKRFGKEEVIVTHSYAYNEDGKLAEESLFDAYVGKLEKKNIYDQQGSIVEVQYYEINYRNGKETPQISSTTSYVYEYNKNGYPISCKDEKGRPESTTEYDKYGNVTERVIYSLGTVSQIFKHSYKYDKKGNVIEKTDYYTTRNADGTTDEREGKPQNIYRYVYDSDNRLIKEETVYHKILERDGKKTKWGDVPVSSFEYKYDEYGNRIESVSPGLTPTTFTYEYDHNGNWLVSQSKQGNKGNLVTRKIEYYSTGATVGEQAGGNSIQLVKGEWTASYNDLVITVKLDPVEASFLDDSAMDDVMTNAIITVSGSGLGDYAAHSFQMEGNEAKLSLMNLNGNLTPVVCRYIESGNLLFIPQKLEYLPEAGGVSKFPFTEIILKPAK